MKIVRQLDREVWKGFVDNHPEGNIFHTPEMYDIFSQTQGYSPSLWATVEGDDRILALLLPVEVTLYGWLKRFSSRAIVYGGVLCVSSPEGQEGLSLLLEHYNRETQHQSIFTEIRNISDATGLQSVLSSNSFVYEDHLNYLIDLSRTPDEILKSFHKRTRKHISRGLRKGALTVEAAEDKDQLNENYELLERTYQLAGIPIAHKSLFESTFEVLVPREMVKFLIAYVDEVPVATSVELLYKDVIYGWYSGMDRSYSSYTPNELIMWHILSWGAENNYRLYDFGGAGKPDEDYGVRDFKAKFGGTLVNFGRNTCVHAPVMLKLSKFGYSLVRKFL